MDEKWRVSHVELLEGGLLFGFVLYDEKGRPGVCFGHVDDKRANLGRNHVATALKDAEQVLGSLSCEANNDRGGPKICLPSGSQRCFANSARIDRAISITRLSQATFAMLKETALLSACQ